MNRIILATVATLSFAAAAHAAPPGGKLVCQSGNAKVTLTADYRSARPVRDLTLHFGIQGTDYQGRAFQGDFFPISVDANGMGFDAVTDGGLAEMSDLTYLGGTRYVSFIVLENLLARESGIAVNLGIAGGALRIGGCRADDGFLGLFL